MGAINYFTSSYITIGYNCDIDYCENDFDSIEEMEEFLQFDIVKSHNEIQRILDKYSFYYFHIAIEPGYYEGFSIDIKNNYSSYYDGYEEKKEIQKEITAIKKFLLECSNSGLVCCSPGWCTRYSNKAETIDAIKEAVKEMREEVRQTSTNIKYMV